MLNALLADISDWDTLMEIPFVLKQAGFNVHVFCSKKSWLIKNSFFDRWIESPSSETEFAEQLVQLVTNGHVQYDWIILGDEKLLSIMNENVHDEELFYKILPLTKIKNRSILASKKGLSELCVEYNIPSPKYLIWNKNFLIDLDNLALQFPVLLKQDLSWGGGGIALCNNKKEVFDHLENYHEKYDVVIQEFIKGEDIGVEAFFYKGELIEYNAGLIKTYYDSAFNFTTRRKYFTNKELETHLREMGKTFGVNGFASIQYVYKKEISTYYLIEVDIRPNIWIPSGRFTGHDFSKAIKIMYEKEAFLHKEIAETSNIEIAIFYRDIIRCVKQKRINELLKWIMNAKGYQWRFIPFYDLKLYRNILFDLTLKKVFKKFKFIS